eukprot:CAMPEP_0198249746 /NCGR_PEP_ID=MMETSP1447-20131203/1161_1 /TAXON_ID=420782 /ORGANISM="Chaetoceros dichaeta, Strain CCMP1751" /LENGTH=499 /DNA_ID=CAMNT_0043934441 /DNA_START=117 /DNA_END=1616 /DNA_ORIENTATION=-
MKATTGRWSLLLTLLGFLHTSSAKSSVVVTNDSRFFIGPIDAPFGFREGGEFSIVVDDFTSTDTDEHHLLPGLLLKRFETESDFSKFKDDILIEPSKSKCSFRNFYEAVGNGTDVRGNNDDHSFAVTADKEDGFFVLLKGAKDGLEINHTFGKGDKGLYFLMYQFCRDESAKGFIPKEVQTSFTLHLRQRNYDRLGNVSYLTAGDMPLPHIFLYFTFSYGILAWFWLRNTRNVVRGEEGGSYGGGGRPTVYAIHHLMSCVLVLKTMSMLFESIRYHFIRVSGHAAIWSVLYYLTIFVGGSILFTVLLLLGSGWSFFKSVLKPREKIIILVVLVLQVINNVALIFLTVETEGERFYDYWRTILHIFDILCCCAVLVPIVWQINALEKAAEAEGGDSASTDEAARTLKKAQLFRSFYLLVVGYIYFTRVGVFLFASALTYEHTWMRYCFTEVGTLTFYCAVGMKFRPISEQFYSQVPNDDMGVSMDFEKEPPSIEMASDQI